MELGSGSGFGGAETNGAGACFSPTFAAGDAERRARSRRFTEPCGRRRFKEAPFAGVELNE